MSFIPPQNDKKPLPCVLLQINHSLFGGKHSSPFLRAYPPALSSYNIPKSSFLAFIDGLNESFLTNPALEKASHIGMGMSAFGGPHAHIIGIAVNMAAKTTAGQSNERKSKVFWEECNKDLFPRHGLEVKVLATHEMLQVVGCPSDQFSHKQFESAVLGGNNAAVLQQEQSQMDRMRALDGWVMPLDYHILTQPPPASSSWTANQTAKKAAKQHEKQAEDLANAHEKRNKKIREANARHDKDMLEYNKELLKLQEKLQDELRKDASSPSKQEKARRKYEEEVQKLEKDKGQGKWEEEMQEAERGVEIAEE